MADLPLTAAELAELRATLAARDLRIEELQAHIRKWPSLECPCCGEEGAWAMFFEDGQKTTCGCGGQVSADGEGAYIMADEDECPKCNGGGAALAAERETQT